MVEEQTNSNNDNKNTNTDTNNEIEWKESSHLCGSRGAGFSLAVKECGDIDGEPWLLLHGFLDNAATWDVLVPKLPLENKRIVCVDFAGHGLSSHAPNGAYHLVDYVLDIACLITKLGWKKYNVLGHSMGCAVAVCLAGSFSEQVEKLILIEGFGPWPIPTSQIPKRLAESIQADLKRLTNSTQPRLFESINDAATRRSEGNFINELPVNAAKILCSRALKQVSGGYVWRSDPGLLIPSRTTFHPEQTVAYASQITAKTLIILTKDGIFKRLLSVLRGLNPFGIIGRILVRLLIIYTRIRMILSSKKDFWEIRYYGIQAVHNFSQQLRVVKNLKYLMLKSGGHHPQLTVPDEVAVHVKEWMEKK